MNVIRRIDADTVSNSELQARLFGARYPRPSLPARLLTTLRLWRLRHRERYGMRRDLPTLPNEVLEDFGLTRQQAESLSRRPFWRA